MPADFFISPVVFIGEETGVKEEYIKNLISLLDEGATIPFIARYRKEKTGSMDEVQIAEFKNLYNQYKELEKRKVSVLESISQQEKLTELLEKQIKIAGL